MTIDEAIKLVRRPEILSDNAKLREVLSRLFESGMKWQLQELRRSVDQHGPAGLIDFGIDVFAGRSHGFIAFKDGTTERV